MKRTASAVWQGDLKSGKGTRLNREYSAVAGPVFIRHAV